MANAPIPDNSVTTPMLVDGSVTSIKLDASLGPYTIRIR